MYALLHRFGTTNPGDGRSQLVGLTESRSSAYATATTPFLEAMHDLRAHFVPDTMPERLALQGIDNALRELSGLDPRPYRVTDEDRELRRSATHALSYAGEPLTAAQEQQVRLFLDFVRHRQP